MSTVEHAYFLLNNPDATPPAPPSPEEVIEKVQQLNPPGSESDVLPPISAEEASAARITVDADIARAILKLLPSGSANGASGWTCGIIRSLYSDGTADDFNAIAALFTAMAGGDLPSTHWVTSRAVLIPKPNNNGLRPLGIGEAWYRYLGRALLHIEAPDVADSIWHLQLGCGVPGGCEIAARAAQAFLEQNPTHVLIKTDFKNAFNLTPRSSIFEGIKRFCPRLLPWFRWAYGASSPLVNSRGEQVGSSETGCRQGDPLASLLFCVAIQAALEELQSELDRLYDNAAAEILDMGRLGLQKGLVLAYMDDCTFSLPWVLVEPFWEVLVTVCERYGLILNVDKCRIIGANATHLQGQLPITTLVDGDIVLGNPVGTIEYRQRICAELVETYTKSLPTLQSLQLSPVVAFNLIKSCINSRVTFLSRVQDLQGIEWLEPFDIAIDSAVFQVAQHYPTAANAEARRALSATIRSMPLPLGGMGIARYSWIAGQAGVIKSRSFLQSYLESRFEHSGEFDTYIDHLAGLNIGEQGCPLRITMAQSNTTDTDDRLVLDGRATVHELVASQYSEFASLITLYLVDANGGNSKPRAAWFRSSQFEGSGRWLTPPAVVSFSPEQTLSADEFRVALRQRLLLAPFEDTVPAAHPSHCLCGTALDDAAQPFHFQDCERNTTHNNTRHSRCKKMIANFLEKHLADRQCRTVGIKENEEPYFRDAIDEHEIVGLRGDIGVYILPDIYRIMDVSVTNPAAARYVNQYRSHEVDDAASTAREGDKRLKYANTHEAINGQFVPFIIESTGRLGRTAVNWLEDLLQEQIAECIRQGRRTPIQQLQSRLCTVITKCNSSVVLYHRRNAWRQHMGLTAAQD